MREGPWARRKARRRTGMHVLLALVLLAVAAGAGYVALVEVPRWLKGSTPAALPTPSPSLSTLDPIQGCKSPGFPDFQDLGQVAWAEGGDLHLVDLPTCRQHVLVHGDVQPPVRFSADGKWLAYGAGSYVPVGGGTPAAVPGGATWWSWSPTGGRLLFVTSAGGVAETEPGGTPHSLVADGSNVRHALWSPDGTMVAVDLPDRILVVDVDTLEPRTVFTTSGRGPQVAGWSPDSGWVLFWGTPLVPHPRKAAGLALNAVPAAGGDWQNVWNEMLPFDDFLAPCGDGVAIAAGGHRLLSQGKQVLVTSPPAWRFHDVTNDFLRSWAWPSCSPDGTWVAATAMANRAEPRFPSGVRSLWIVATHGSRRTRIEPSGLGALETPRWSADGRTVLVVERTENDWGAPGSLALVQVNPKTGRDVQRANLEIDLGSAPGPGGHQRWSEISDWFRPPRGG
jgi:hypothetical protein